MCVKQNLSGLKLWVICDKDWLCKERLNNQRDLVEILVSLKPLAVIKG